MSWSRTTFAAVVGGIAMWLVSFLLHGVVMGNTYVKYPDVFAQTASNPLLFLVLEILIAFPAAVVFAKTRASWTKGIKGGLAFGFWLGLIGSFAQLFSPMIMEGFPYYLGWCWFGINLIVTLVLGATLGAMIKRS